MIFWIKIWEDLTCLDVIIFLMWIPLFNLIAFIAEIIISKQQSSLRYSPRPWRQNGIFFLNRGKCGGEWIETAWRLTPAVCASVYVPRRAGTMHQGGGVGIPAKREEGLTNVCACANSLALTYPHVGVHATLCTQVQTNKMHRPVFVSMFSGCFCPEPSCNQDVHSTSMLYFYHHYYYYFKLCNWILTYGMPRCWNNAKSKTQDYFTRISH